MRDIEVELVQTAFGDEWWVYRGDDLIAKFFNGPDEAEEFADWMRLEA